jgi:DNA modification methylase
MKPYHSTEHGDIYCAECVEFMQTLEPDSIDMIITSPPYDNVRTFKFGDDYTYTFEEFQKQAAEIKRIRKYVSGLSMEPVGRE